MNNAALPNFQSFAGELRITPGVPPPQGLRSSRRDWAARLSPGVPVANLPGLMASLFNLCHHAHSLCSQLAIGAVTSGEKFSSIDAAESLRRETAMEHVRRISLDWPRLLAPANTHAVAAMEALQIFPRITRDIPHPWPALQLWLHHSLLQMPVTDWLAAWRADGADWLATWSQRQNLWLPKLLNEVQAIDSGIPFSPEKALQPHADALGLGLFGANLARQPDFAMNPQWNGTCAHTGTWSRLHDAVSSVPLTPWGMLGVRIAELCQLTLEDGAQHLSWGAVPTGPQRGLAWVEMARGLLVHQVELEPTLEHIKSCCVVSPTEWNFHPQGEVAQRLANMDAKLPASTLDRHVNLLMAAFDPCVSFHIDSLDTAHAASSWEMDHA